MINLNLNIETKTIIDAENGFVDLAFSRKPSVQYNNNDVVRIQLFDARNEPVGVDLTDTFALAMDINYTHDDDLCVYSSDFTIVDAAEGVIEIPIMTNTVGFRTKITKPNTKLFMQIKRYPAGNTQGVTLVQDDIPAYPSVMDAETPPEIVSPDYYTAVETTALVQSIPKGDPGPQGPIGEAGEDGKNFTVDATGVLADLVNYNAEPKGFSYLATDNGNIYIKEDDLSGAWSAGIPFRGPEGPAGADGVDGVKGDQGEPGLKGDQGDTGPKGDQGEQGEQGPAGADGTDGVDGVDGTSFEVTETGLLAGLSAYDAELKGFTYLATDIGALYIKQSNTSGDWSDPIPFQGPQGPAGADGVDGAKGDQGDQGPKGDAGEDGAPFVYTDFTQEQLALLVGPQGEQGEQGPAGADGKDGIDGADGLANPMTTAGDIIVGSTDGAPARLAKGADGKVLGVESGAVAWVTPTGGGGGSVITACTLPVPSDPDEDALHFEAELSLDPLFEAAGSIFVKSATGYASIKVFSGLQWIPFPSDGVGLPFYGSHVRFDVVAEGVYYGRARWYDGTAWSDYRGFIFPSISI